MFIANIYLALNQIDIFILIGVRADEFAVKFGTGGVDAARSRSYDLFAFSQIEIRRRQDFAPGQPDD